MIPQEKSEAVTRALREAFGVTKIDDIRMMTKGHTSSLVFRILVRGAPFLLKIILRTDDATRHYTCMRAAAEAGLAPHVWYTSIPDRISITDFVEGAPFSIEEALVRIPATLRMLHALPPFPRVPDPINTSCMFLINKGAALDGFMQRFQAAKILPQSETEELFARYAQLVAAYPYQNPEMVSSHNDLFKPDNVLFDGQRVWLVDWEAAFLNDRYADLAAFANLTVNNDVEEQIYLQAYFGEAPDQYQVARFFCMRQVVHAFYAMVFLMSGSGDKPVDWSDKAPEFREFHRHIWEGEINLADKETKTAYGRVHLERLLENTRQGRFTEALRIVSSA